LKKQEVEKQFEQRIKESKLLIYKVCRAYAFTEADRQDLFQEMSSSLEDPSKLKELVNQMR
jgi:RNA polymerase sigma-70 factor (ECF subfamily)